jgi:hypothetical protein
MKNLDKNNRKLIILRSAFAVALIIIFVGFSMLKTQDQESKQIEQIQQQITLDENIYHLPNNFKQGGLNLVFYADQYSNWEEFDSDIDSLMTEIKKIEPWDDYQYFNIFKINDQDSAGTCYTKTENERKVALRCRDEINDYLKKLPLEKFKLVVLSKQEFQSWANMVRIENSGIFHSIPNKLETSTDKITHGLLFAHLLGHAFGLKDEEYFVIAKAGGAPHTPDGPNCVPDVTTAQARWGDIANQYDAVGYFQGCCGNKTYIKPTESSIMNLNSGTEVPREYGPVSEAYLNKVLKYCFTPSELFSKKIDAEFLDYYPEFANCVVKQ